MKTAKELIARRLLLIKTLNELVELKLYTNETLAKELGTYRQRVADIRNDKVVILRSDIIEKYLKILHVK